MASLCPFPSSSGLLRPRPAWVVLLRAHILLMLFLAGGILSLAVIALALFVRKPPVSEEPGF